MRIVALGLACALGASAADSIEGRVWERSGEELRPLAKALITLSQEGRGPGPSMIRSNADGLWRIEGPLAGRYYVSAARPGYYVAAAGETTRDAILVDCTKTCGPVDFELVRGGAVNGVVEDEQGEPLQSVSVRVRLDEERAQEMPDEPRRFGGGPGFAGGGFPGGGFRGGPWPGESVHTDDLGRFRAAGLRPGRYRIEAESSRRPGSIRYELAAAPAVEIEAGEELEIRVAMQRMEASPGLTVSGTVQGVDLSARRRTLFAASSSTGGGPGPRFGRRMGQVGEDGAFQIQGLEPGRYHFSYWRDGERGMSSQIPVGSFDIAGNMTGLVLSPVPTVGVSGRFELESDSEVRGVSAQLDPLDGSPGVGLNAGRVDRDFHAQILAGTYRVRARSREWFLTGVQLRGEPLDPANVAIQSDTDDFVILLSDRFARIEGRIRAASAEAAAPRYIVTLSSEDEEDRSEARPTDQNGGFVFDRIAPGEYRVCARAYDAPRDAACALERRFPVEAGAQIELGLTLPQ